MFVVGDIVRATIDITGTPRHVVGEVISATESPWGDVRYDVLSPAGPFRFSHRHVAMDVEATVLVGLLALEGLRLAS